MSTVVEDFRTERDAFRRTILDLGPDGPTMCGTWNTGDLAAHVAAGELNGGWAVVPFRMMVDRGIRIDRTARVNTGATRLAGRRGFDWATRRLAKPPPRGLELASVAVVSLFEVWAHHEDVLVANGLTCSTGIDLEPVVAMLRRYQRKELAASGAVVSGSLAEQAAILSGRVPFDGATFRV
jgi:uncharacterized protein (TIGR03083 family)